MPHACIADLTSFKRLLGALCSRGQADIAYHIRRLCLPEETGDIVGVPWWDYADLEYNITNAYVWDCEQIPPPPEFDTWTQVRRQFDILAREEEEENERNRELEEEYEEEYEEDDEDETPEDSPPLFMPEEYL